MSAPFDQRSVAVSVTRRLGQDWAVTAGAGAVGTLLSAGLEEVEEEDEEGSV